VEGAFIGCLITDEERELGGHEVAGEVRALIEALALETLGALSEPKVLGHLFHEQLRGCGCGFVFRDEVGDQVVKILRVLVTDEDAAGCEAVPKGILTRASFAGVGLGAG
jgi:hypothetical protein